MKILYLYQEVMGYTVETLKALSKRNVDVHVIHWDHKKLTPYKIPEINNIKFYKRSSFDFKEMRKLTLKIDPDLTVVSGWVDLCYLRISRLIISRNKNVIVGFDDQWHGTFKQIVAQFLGKFKFFKFFFSLAWVSGIYQFEYARKLGFTKQEIIYDLYSANVNMFNTFYLKNRKLKQKNYPKTFLYVGRLEKEKGIQTLIKSWNQLTKKNGWKLCLIGSGSLKNKIIQTEDLVIKEFMQPEFLVKEIKNAGFFILPSDFEPWGVVVHEFCAAGLPMLLSEAVGASTSFLIQGHNGYLFKTNNYNDLLSKIKKVINLNKDELLNMSNNSNKISYKITPETSADNLLSCCLKQ